MNEATKTETRQRANRRVVQRLGIAALAMFGFGYALVPLYDVICDITGINGKTGRADAAAYRDGADQQRLVTVEFVSSVNTGLPWEMQPLTREIQVHPGELTEVFFEAVNLSKRTRVGQAVPSVSPPAASKYFFKTECFCFTAQELGGGERRRMPVKFVVDKRLPADIDALTLSYTFFGSPEAAAEDPAG